MRISDWSSDVCSSDLVDTGDYIVIINAADIVVTGNKAQDKKYFRHTTYPGGIRETNFEKLQQRFPGRAIDRKSVVSGKSVSVRVDLGGRGTLKKNTKTVSVRSKEYKQNLITHQ